MARLGHRTTCAALFPSAARDSLASEGVPPERAGACVSRVLHARARGGSRLVQLTSLEWRGKRWASGFRATAMLFTAVAASPKPVAISLTLPGYAAMSPAA